MLQKDQDKGVNGMICFVCNLSFKDEEKLRLHCLWAHGVYRQHCQNPNSINNFTEEKALKRDLDLNIKRFRGITRAKVDWVEVVQSMLRLQELNIDISDYVNEFGFNWYAYVNDNFRHPTMRYTEQGKKRQDDIMDKEDEILQMVKEMESTV
jgi:hypothetical protein